MGVCRRPVEYSLFPSVPALSNYRQAETQYYFNQNGQAVFNSAINSPEIQMLVAQSQVNDILLGCSLYGKTVTEVYDGNEVIIHEPDNITININPLGDSKYDYVVDFYSQEDIRLYGLTNDLNSELAAVHSYIADTSKKDPAGSVVQQVIWTGVDHTVDLVSKPYPVVGMIWSAGTSIRDCYSAYDSANEYNEVLEMLDDATATMNYVSALHMGGSVIQCGESYTINNIVCDEALLTSKVDVYNSVSGNEPITENDLINSFNSYTSGGEPGVLDDFSDCDELDLGNAGAK